MSSSIRETALALVVATFNGATKPSGVPNMERDRWVDIEVGPTQLPCCILAGFRDRVGSGETYESTQRKRMCIATVQFWAKSITGKTAAQSVDEMYQWLCSCLACGVMEKGHAFAGKADQIEIGEMTLAVATGGVVRGLCELVIDYRMLASDATKSQ